MFRSPRLVEALGNQTPTFTEPAAAVSFRLRDVTLTLRGLSDRNVCLATVKPLSGHAAAAVAGQQPDPVAVTPLRAVLVLLQRFARRLGRHGLQSLSLVLPGLVVQEDADEDEDGAGGAEDGDVVAEHDDAEPNRQGVFDGAGHAEEETRRPLLLAVQTTVACCSDELISQADTT